MLSISDIYCSYSGKPVVTGVSFSLNPREISVLFGANGAGKSTVLKAIMGLVRIDNGKISNGTVCLNDLSTSERSRLGIGYCPQSCGAFMDMTVMDNLAIGGRCLARGELNCRINEMFSVFPLLRARAFHRAQSLSGGERQMLSVARALMPRPSVVLLDEPSLGMAPGVFDTLLSEIHSYSIGHNAAVLIVEHRIEAISKYACRGIAMKAGGIERSGAYRDMLCDRSLLEKIYLY